MNEKEYKKVLDQLEPDDSLREKVWKGLGNKTSFLPKVRASTVAFVAVLILSIVSFNTLLKSEIEKSKLDKVKYSKMEKKAVSDVFIGFEEKKSGASGSDSIKQNGNQTVADKILGKSELENKSSLKSADFAGLADSMYQTECSGSFNFESRNYREDKENNFYNIQILKGEKIGTTSISFFKGAKGNESFKDEPFHPNKNDLKAYPNGYEIYSVKGYDPAYRLMIYGESNGKEWGSIYNCFTGKYITSGKDVFGHLYLKGNIKLARWRSIDSYRRKLEVYKSVEQSVIFENFVDVLYKSKALTSSNLPNIDHCKIVYLTMKNQLVEQIWLYPDTKIVEYREAHLYFKVDDEQFDSFFKTLK